MQVISHSRDTLNPLLNTDRLRTRLDAIELYRHRHGELYARWPHFVMTRMGQHLYRYKFNYAVKGFAAFLVFQEYQEYKQYCSKAISTY